MGDLENDYNHGTEFAWSVPLADATTIVRALGESSAISALSISDSAPTATYRTGQIFYTPSDIETDKLRRGDRPYAAWLYTGVDFESTDLDADPARRNDRHSTVGIKVGTIGPSALGKQIHTEWHDFFGLTHPGGWDHQLKDEPGLLITADRDWRVGFSQLSETGDWQVDSAVNAGASLGNVRTEARLGGRLRLGQSLDRGWDTHSTNGLQTTTDGLDWELFVAGESHLVGQDIFLDGNTFKSSHSVEKDAFVSEIGLGITAKFAGLSISLGHFLRTEEFELQDGPMTFWTLDIRSQ